MIAKVGRVSLALDAHDRALIHSVGSGWEQRRELSQLRRGPARGSKSLHPDFCTKEASPHASPPCAGHRDPRRMHAGRAANPSRSRIGCVARRSTCPLHLELRLSFRLGRRGGFRCPERRPCASAPNARHAARDRRRIRCTCERSLGEASFKMTSSRRCRSSFPLGTCQQVKDVANPKADWKHRLVAAYSR